MKEISCAMIRDLLPSYVESLCAEETRQAVEEHLADCPACRQLCDDCSMEIRVPVEAAPKSERNLRKHMRLRLSWYLFWPMLYALSYQFGIQDRIVLGLVWAAVIIWVGLIMMPHYDTYFDDEKRKEYYARGNRDIEAGKGSPVRQALFWLVPVALPLLCHFLPMIVGVLRTGKL